MNKKVKRVSLVADPYPPYQFEEKGIMRGVDYEIISEAFRVHDIHILTRLYSWEECMQKMKDKEADGIFQITRTPAREKAFLFSETLRTAKTVFFKREIDSTEFERGVDITEQIHGLKIGLLSGYSYDEDIDGLGDEFKLKVWNSEQLVKALVRGDCDLALLDEGVAFYLIKKLRIKGVIKTRGYEIERRLYVGFQKDMIDLADLFNEGLWRVRRDGLYDKILDKYGLGSAD